VNEHFGGRNERKLCSSQLLGLEILTAAKHHLRNSQKMASLTKRTVVTLVCTNDPHNARDGHVSRTSSVFACSFVFDTEMQPGAPGVIFCDLLYLGS
jgi:hypothetical protein